MSSSQNESALEKFVEKIDFAKLDGKPEDFYKAGIAFVGNGQFDDGIIEFVKIIKTVSHQDSLFINAIKELKSMGFSNNDISVVTGVLEFKKDTDIEVHTVTEIHTDTISATNPSSTAKLRFSTIGIGIYWIFLLLSSIDMDNASPDSYETWGNLMFAAGICTLFGVAPLTILSIIAEMIADAQKAINGRDTTISILKAILLLSLVIVPMILFFRR